MCIRDRILPAGQRVDQNFTIPTPYDASATNFYVGVRPQSDNISYKSVNSDINPVTGVSNYEYERRRQDNISLIKVLKPNFLSPFVEEFAKLMR